jgi:hypothetical protein
VTSGRCGFGFHKSTAYFSVQSILRSISQVWYGHCVLIQPQTHRFVFSRREKGLFPLGSAGVASLEFFSHHLSMKYESSN